MEEEGGSYRPLETVLRSPEGGGELRKVLSRRMAQADPCNGNVTLAVVTRTGEAGSSVKRPSWLLW